MCFIWYVSRPPLTQLERAGAPSLDEGMSLDDPQLLMEVLEMQETLAEAEDPSIVDEVGRTNQGTSPQPH